MTAAINILPVRSGQNRWKIRRFFSHMGTHTLVYFILFNHHGNLTDMNIHQRQTIFLS